MTVGKIAPQTAHTETFAISRLHLPGPGNKSNWQTERKTEKSFAHCEWLLWHLFGACNSLDISMLLLVQLNAQTYNGRKF